MSETKTIQCSALIDFVQNVVEASKEGWELDTTSVERAPRKINTVFFTIMHKENAVNAEQPTVVRAKPVPPKRVPKAKPEEV